MMQLFQANYHLSSIIHMQYDITLDSSYTYGSIYIYNFQTEEILKQLTLTSSSLPILSLSLRSDGLFLAYISSRTVTVVDIITGTDVFTKNMFI
ncbi:unnamed protein product [Rotaria sordida]|uniref:Uncharacterized protein n=1 Tax=Rotaria sordida TaxID=392033 RepID=A0A816FPF3_9BILA|nr:unnamed protein product [Rotaria sordida]CAF1663928.1 unnamed protein product [Rotaria sordida]